MSGLSGFLEFILGPSVQDSSSETLLDQWGEKKASDAKPENGDAPTLSERTEELYVAATNFRKAGYDLAEAIARDAAGLPSPLELNAISEAANGVDTMLSAAIRSVLDRVKVIRHARFFKKNEKSPKAEPSASDAKPTCCCTSPSQESHFATATSVFRS